MPVTSWTVKKLQFISWTVNKRVIPNLYAIQRTNDLNDVHRRGALNAERVLPSATVRLGFTVIAHNVINLLQM